MEPFSALGASASAIGIIGAGLKAAKGIYKVLSGVADGPQNVQQAANDVYGLLSTLQHLSQCRALENNDSEIFETRLLGCVDDLERFDGELKRLVISESERRCGRYWKKIKVIFNEKLLANMSSVVNGHTSALNLHLTALNSDIVYGIPDQLRDVSQELAAQKESSKTHLTVLREHGSLLRELSTGIAQSRAGWAFVQNSAQRAATRDEEAMQMLKRVLEQVSSLTVTQQRSEKAIHIQSGSSIQKLLAQDVRHDIEPSCAKFLDAISQLCDLSQHSQGIAVMNDGKSVAESLLAILSFMTSPAFLESVVLSRLMECGFSLKSPEEHLADLETSIRFVYGTLLSVQNLELNAKGPIRQRTTRACSQSRWKVSIYDIGFGVLRVTTAERTWSHPQRDVQAHAEVPNARVDVGEAQSTISITFKPRYSHLRRMINLTSNQFRQRGGVFSTVPHLSVHNTLPADSPVFSIVNEGRLEDFQALLREGKASLRDQDEHGVSLLHYAVHPEMCRYLIETGADVDHVATTVHLNGFNTWSTPLDFIDKRHRVEKVDDAQRKDLVGCQKLLLEAGSDASAPCIYNGVLDLDLGGFATVAFSYGDPEQIEMLLDYGEPFINANSISELGSPLSQLCVWDRWTAEAFAVLIRKGADIHKVHEDGTSVLHECFLGPWERHWTQYFRGLQFLVGHGADVFAVSTYGIAVSDYAYGDCFRKGGTIGKPRVSMKGDVWDRVLATCGYNISDFREAHPRQAIYTEEYKRADFEEMWAGQEQLCPYFDDDISDSRGPHSWRAVYTKKYKGADFEEMWAGQEQLRPDFDDGDFWCIGNIADIEEQIEKGSVTSDSEDGGVSVSEHWDGQTAEWAD